MATNSFHHFNRNFYPEAFFHFFCSDFNGHRLTIVLINHREHELLEVINIRLALTIVSSLQDRITNQARRFSITHFNTPFIIELCITQTCSIRIPQGPYLQT